MDVAGLHELLDRRDGAMEFAVLKVSWLKMKAHDPQHELLARAVVETMLMDDANSA